MKERGSQYTREVKEDKSTIELLSQPQFIHDFAKNAQRANKSIGMMVMGITPGEDVEQVLEAYEKSPATEKVLNYDSIARLSQDAIVEPYSWVPGLREKMGIDKFNQALDALTDTFKNVGTKVHELNPVKPGVKGFIVRMFPFLDRSHIKGAFTEGIDKAGTIFYATSANLDSDLSENSALKFFGKEAKKITRIFKTLMKPNVYLNKDHEIKINDTVSVLIDRGKPKESIILDTMIKHINSAEKYILNKSFLYPDGKVDEGFQKAHERGVHVDVLTTKMEPKRPMYSGNNILYVANKVTQFISKVKNHNYPINFYPFGNMHTKFLDIDGRVVFFGSHNASKKGVDAGTREMTFKITDKRLIKDMEKDHYDSKVFTNPEVRNVL